ncbi:MAG: hypothetical protein Q8R32_01480 [bacterium]|nr:hypothetical protein [bacterium]
MHAVLLVLALLPQATSEEMLQLQWRAAQSVTVSLPGHVVVLEKKEVKDFLAALTVDYVWEGAAGATEPTVFVQFGKGDEKLGILGVVGSGAERFLELQSDRRIVGISPRFAEALNKLLTSRLKKDVDVLK